MFVLMRTDAGAASSAGVRRWLEQRQAAAQEIDLGGRCVVAWSGGEAISLEALADLPEVDEVLTAAPRLPLVSRRRELESSRIDVGGVEIGGREIVVIAGPCAVEDRDLMLEIARAVRDGGAGLLRGGAFKPRTSPYSFQGLGNRGLEILAAVRDEVGLPIVTEVLDVEWVSRVAEVADMIQVGARNMQNFSLLKRLGRCDRPVLLKRGMTATVEEWLGAAEYILEGGNSRVVLCERGIRTFAQHARNTLDLGVLSEVRQRTHLPVIVDPSHAAGARAKVPSLARAAVAAGADGLMIEVHAEPERALSDGPQALYPESFTALMGEVSRIAEIVGRTLPRTDRVEAVP